MVTAPILVLGTGSALADISAPAVQLWTASPRVILAAGDKGADKAGSQTSNDPAMVNPDADEKGFKQKESMSYEIDEKAGPDKPNVQKEKQAVPRTFKDEDHVGIQSGPTNQTGTSVREDRKDIVPGTASGPRKPNQGDETFQQQEQTGVPDPQKPKPQ